MTARRFVVPRPLRVETDRREQPRAFTWAGCREWVATVEESWATGTGWWGGVGGDSRRHYYRLVTRSGLRAELYREETSGGWFMAAITD